MKYDVKSKLLSSDDGSWFKRLDCPLNKKWHELQRKEPAESSDALFYGEPHDQQGDLRRRCPSCGKDVIDIATFDDREVGALVSVDPGACVHASSKSAHITFEGTEGYHVVRGPIYSCSENSVGVPIVHTARTVYGINIAAKEGYWPLLRPVEPSGRIRQKLLVSQNSDGTVEIGSDFRAQAAAVYWYNPYRSPLPFAAYLIPPDLNPGTRVYLSDLIEDIEGATWNQGDSYRKRSAYAVWDGKDLAIEQEEPISFVG